MVKIIQTGVPTWVDLDKPSAIGIEELAITPSTQLRPVAETIAVIGAPVCMHTVGDKSSPNAVIARWRHSGGDFDISASDIVSVTMNLQDVGLTLDGDPGALARGHHRDASDRPDMSA